MTETWLALLEEEGAEAELRLMEVLAELEVEEDHSLVEEVGHPLVVLEGQADHPWEELEGQEVLQ